MRALVTNDDAKYVREFLDHFLQQEEEGNLDENDFSTKAFHSRIQALNKGFGASRFNLL